MKKVWGAGFRLRNAAGIDRAKRSAKARGASRRLCSTGWACCGP